MKIDSHIVTQLILEHGDEDQQMPMQIAPQDVLDVPNEPIYCLCHQVYYGKMIGCDNPDVSETLAKSNKSLNYQQFWCCSQAHTLGFFPNLGTTLFF